MGALKCEHIKSLGGFTPMSILVKPEWVGHFRDFVRVILMSS